jgi:peptidoglycan/LPS O-acetylase OafA/YrhL
MTERPRPSRIDHLDGIRAVTALWVVAHHAWQFAISTADHGAASSWFKPFSVLKYGEFGVAMFIVLSGYCLAMPVLRTPALTLRGGVGTFVARRSQRILPPYYAALALSIVAIAVVPVLRESRGTPWDITLPSFAWVGLLTHLGMVHNLFENARWAINPPMWTVALEFQIYIAFALVLLPVWRRRGFLAPLVVAAGATAAGVLLGLSFAKPWMVIAFIMGAGAAQMCQQGRVSRQWELVAIVLIVLIPAVTFGVEEANGEVLGQMMTELWVAGAAAALLIALVRAELLAWPKAVLSSRLLTWIGLRSYSLYLIHYPLIALTALAVDDAFVLSVPATFALVLALGLAVSMSTTALFHAAFERPFMHAPTSRSPKNGDCVSSDAAFVEPVRPTTELVDSLSGDFAELAVKADERMLATHR